VTNLSLAFVPTWDIDEAEPERWKQAQAALRAAVGCWLR